MRLRNKVAIVVGAGQTPGETIGNGRATSVLFAREGARVLLVDCRLESVSETENMIKNEGGECSSFEADITREADCKAMADACIERYGRIDILHNNVGKSEGDRELSELPEKNWREIMDLNLKGMYLTCKYVLPVMRKQGGGVILNISSIASVCSWQTVAYMTSKAAVNALTHHIALTNAEYGIRCNAILPGLLDTPMAIERRACEQKVPRSKIREVRDSQVPLRHKMGTAWDTAYAALFLASDEAKFITGISLPVDGGQSARIG